MRIRNGKPFRSISRNGNCVSFRAGNFLDGIDNLITGILFIKIFPDISPVVSIIQGDRITDSSFICIQLNLYAFWTLSILVIVIFPCLGYRHAGLSRSIAVDNIITIDRGTVVSKRFFGNCIDNLFAILVLRQTSKGIGPASICSGFNDSAVNLLTIRKQIDCNAFRTLAILIISVIPGLGS